MPKTTKEKDLRDDYEPYEGRYIINDKTVRDLVAQKPYPRIRVVTRGQV